MPRLNLGGLWNIIREINFQDIHAEADRRIEIVVAGSPDGPAQELATVLRSNEAVTRERPTSVVRTASTPLDDRDFAGATLLITAGWAPEVDNTIPQSLPIIAVTLGRSLLTAGLQGPLVAMPAVDREQAEQLLAPIVVEELKDSALAAARRLPILRHAYAHQLIGETAQANAVYALSTGLAEVVPALSVPLYMADIVVLTKNQATMVYRLALAAGRGMSPRRVLGELLGVIGAGFMWRQITRELVGLIPVVGILPKVAVAYAGTYAVGQTAQIYLMNGQRLSHTQLQTLYREALERGRTLAQSLIRHQDQEAKQLTHEPEGHPNA